MEGHDVEDLDLEGHHLERLKAEDLAAEDRFVDDIDLKISDVKSLYLHELQRA